jgi:hypothetical protein
MAKEKIYFKLSDQGLTLADKYARTMSYGGMIISGVCQERKTPEREIPFQ